MGNSTSLLTEVEINEFRKLNPEAPQVDLELPIPPEQRKVTDKKGFIIVGILVLILLPFLIYALVKSDIRRLDHGSDNCGNLCGVANKKIKGIECSGKDFSNKPFELFNLVTRQRNCTNECPPGYHLSKDGNCYDLNTERESIDLLTHSLQFWWKFIIVIIITTILSILSLLLFRLCPRVMVWGVLAVGILFSVAVTVLFWYLFARADVTDEFKPAYLGLGLISTIFAIAIIIMFLIFRNKIQLIVLLYKETAKALFDVPLMMLLPVITLALQFVIVSLLLLTTAFMQTGANLVKDEKAGFYTYQRNGAMVFAMIMNAIVTIWALEFFTGCQCMVLAGTVSQWFFKKNPNSPITVSFTNTMRFHLGTVAFGSFIITLVAVIKALIKSLIGNSKMRWLVECICGNIEALLKFLSRNAYVETALYGQSFFRSGRRAATLLVKNAVSVLAVNSVGNFVLAMTQFILLVITTAIAYGIFWTYEFSWFATVISFIGNLIIVAVVFNVFETIVDTLLVCFCEDAALNDGASVTSGFKEFVEETKKVYKK